MKYYIITYFVRTSNDYNKLFTKPYNLFLKCFKCQDTTWLVCSEDDASQIYFKIKPLTDDKDMFLIMEIKPNENHFGWMPASVWEWISDNIKNPNVGLKSIN